MKYLTPLLFAGLLLFPSFSHAATLTPAQRANILQEITILEGELNALLASQTTCPSGQAYTNGSCQWTASSTAAINAIAQQKSSQAQIAAQENAATAAIQKNSQIKNLQAEYQGYVTDAQNALADGQACLTKYQNLANDQLTTGTSAVARGNAAATAQSASVQCESIIQADNTEEQFDANAEASVQAQIQQVQNSN